MLVWPSSRAGSARRVEIARALLCPGGAVILDEPFTGLDTAARDACAEVVLDLLDGRMLLLGYARCRRRSGPQYLGHHHALNTYSATK